MAQAAVQPSALCPADAADAATRLQRRSPRRPISLRAGSVAELAAWLDMGGSVDELDRRSARGSLLHAAARANQVECLKVSEGNDGA